MGTVLNRYRAFDDPVRFKRGQTRAEQIRMLRTLSYVDGGITGEYGEIIELQNAIDEDRERIPGRSAADSAGMVDEALAWIRAEAHRPSNESPGRGPLWLLTGGALAMAALVIAGLPYALAALHMLAALAQP